MGHGTVADEIKGRQAHGERTGSILSIAEEGVRFRSYLDGSEQFMAPETSMEIQAALRLRHRARVRRVHAVQRHPRLHRALDRAHPPLARPLPGLARRARPGRPARLRDRPGRGRGGPAARLGAGGRRARPGRDRDRRHAGRGQAADVRGRRVGGLRAAGRAARATCSGSARSTTCCAASSSASTPSTARCPPASAATAWRSSRTRPCAGAWISPRAATARPTSRSSRAARARPAPAATPAPTSTTCSRRRESTASRLLTIHNLAYLQMLMAALRDAIAAGRLAEATAAARAGAAPWELERNCACEGRVRGAAAAQRGLPGSRLTTARIGPLPPPAPEPASLPSRR